MPDSYQSLADQRARFATEMQADPDVKDRLQGLTYHEVGGQGAEAQHAFIESVMNRAAARGQSLRRAMGTDYYPGKSLRYAPGADYSTQIDAALGGSNISGLATGNASLDVGFAGGPQTFTAGGERFGIEGPDVGWAAGASSSLGKPLPAPAAAAATRATQPTGAAADPGIRDLSAVSGLAGSGPFAGAKPQGMIIHHTSGRGGVDGVEQTLRERGLSVQYVIDREGNISRLLPEGTAGAHMLPGWGEKGRGLSNRNMAGVEIIARDDKDVNEKQLEAAGRLLSWHSREYGYDPRTHVFGHGEVNPGHKEADEGMAVVSRLRAGTLPMSVAAAPRPGTQAYWEQGRAKAAPKEIAQTEPKSVAKPGSAAFWGATRAKDKEVADAGGRSTRAAHGGHGGPHPARGHGPGLGAPAFQSAAFAGADVGGPLAGAAEQDFFDDGRGELRIEVDVPMRFY